MAETPKEATKDVTGGGSAQGPAAASPTAPAAPRAAPPISPGELPEAPEIGGRKLIGQILKEMRLVTEAQIQEALAIQKQSGGAIGAILVSLNYVTEQ